MSAGYNEACQSLSWCQSFDPAPYAWTWSGWRRYGSLSDETKPASLGSGETEPMALGKTPMASRSGEMETASLGSGEMEPVPKGSGETEPATLGVR